ncbi:hypothetical protein Mapa_015646 [Marchantia paleacea]|nr:hypothetical protein Mapa_015646 [Marchantia paleacea]
MNMPKATGLPMSAYDALNSLSPTMNLSRNGYESLNPAIGLPGSAYDGLNGATGMPRSGYDNGNYDTVNTLNGLQKVAYEAGKHANGLRRSPYDIIGPAVGLPIFGHDGLASANGLPRGMFNPNDGFNPNYPQNMLSVVDFNVNGNGLIGSSLHEKGFSYCWSGARANLGVLIGRYYFGCKVTVVQKVDMPDRPNDQKNLCRMGVSRGYSDVAYLGESKHSFEFGDIGKFSVGGSFKDYGQKFGVGDTIVCAVDLESKPMAKFLSP